jgi:hypothetical protein
MIIEDYPILSSLEAQRMSNIKLHLCFTYI